MNILNEVTVDNMQEITFPINELLDNSCYYPSSGFDGSVVKHLGNQIQSYFYCDYATGEPALQDHLNRFRGYQLVGQRSLMQQELIPHGWQMELPPNIDMQEYSRYRNVMKTPFATWAVFERLPSFDELHGPNRFSLVYIGGEGVATYQALYWANKKTAKAIAIIRPGTGFGFNWTDFRKPNSPFAWVVLNNQFGKPDMILSNTENLEWPNFKCASTIQDYYRYFVWERSKNIE